MDIHYTRGNISKAVFHLSTADEPMPRRAWDAYLIATRGPARDEFEAEFRALDTIFAHITNDQVTSRLRLEDARRGAAILLDLHDALVAKSAR